MGAAAMKNIIMTKIFLTALVFMLIAPVAAHANGGDQRVVDGTYLINLSRSPFTPTARQETQFLASFVDLKTNRLIDDDLIVTIRIGKLGESAKGKFVFEKNVKTDGAVFGFTHIFKSEGLHEVFFDFGLASNPNVVYAAPDFLIDVQEPIDARTSASYGVIITAILLGSVVGFAIKSLVGTKNSHYKRTIS